MVDSKDGRVFGIPRNRRLSWDLLHFNKSVPQCAHSRTMNLAAIAEARSHSAVRISWPALFIKAFAIVAAEVPELRQTWYRWPFAHLYQHPSSNGVLTVQRQFRNAPWLFWGCIEKPEELSLEEIQNRIQQFTTECPKRIFRQQVRLAGLPTLLRRMIWGWNIHVAKSKRASRLGTFFLSTLAGQETEIQVPPSIQTGCLTYGPLDEGGLCRVTLAYDHRVMDGAAVAGILKCLELTLLETVRPELLKVSASTTNIRDVA